MSTLSHPSHTHDDSRLSEPARRVVSAAVTDRPVDEAALTAQVRDEAAGAVVTFSGVVRNHDRGAAVLRLEYVGHPTAGAVIAEVAAEVTAAHPVDRVAVAHRVGPLEVGETALFVAVSAAHRREAFEAASELVEQVKHRLPVWKHQFLADGTDEWVNCP